MDSLSPSDLVCPPRPTLKTQRAPASLFDLCSRLSSAPTQPPSSVTEQVHTPGLNEWLDAITTIVARDYDYFSGNLTDDEDFGFDDLNHHHNHDHSHDHDLNQKDSSRLFPPAQAQMATFPESPLPESQKSVWSDDDNDNDKDNDNDSAVNNNNDISRSDDCIHDTRLESKLVAPKSDSSDQSANPLCGTEQQTAEGTGIRPAESAYSAQTVYDSPCGLPNANVSRF